MSTAAILAGGRALRFGGRPKLLLPLGGQRIVDRLLAVLRAVADQVFIVANDSEPYAGLGVPVQPDVLAGAGPLGGVHAALRRSRSPRTLVVAGDMPFLSAPFVDHLLHAGGAVDVSVPRYGRRLSAALRLLPSVVHPGPRAPNRGGDAAGARRRCRKCGDTSWARTSSRRSTPMGTLFFNVNTPAGHARALAIAACHGG